MPTAAALDALLGTFTPDPSSPYPAAVQKALLLARRLQERARELQTPLGAAPAGRTRPHAADAVRQGDAGADDRPGVPHQRPARAPSTSSSHILDVQGVPRFFSPFDRTLLKGFQSFGGYVPGVAVPLVKEHMQQGDGQRHPAGRAGAADARTSASAAPKACG